MPTKRRLSKQRAHRITAEAVEAFRAGDFIGLHRALGLAPWQASPLPSPASPLGVDPAVPPSPTDGTAWAVSWPLAVELQKDLAQS